MKTTKNGQELKAGDKVIVKSFLGDRQGVIWENQAGTMERDVRVAFGDPATSGKLESVSLSQVEKI